MSDLPKDIRRRFWLQGLTASWLLSVSRIGLAADPAIVAVRVWPSETYTRITLESKQVLKYRQFALHNPERIVVDIEDAQLNSVLQGITTQVKVSDPYLKQIRVGQFDTKTVRLVMELKQQITPNVFALKPVAEFRNRLVVDLYPLKGGKEYDPLLALLEDYNDDGWEKKLPPAESPTSLTSTAKRPLVIMLDPGHGGEDPGAIGKRKTREKDVVLQIARRLRTTLKRYPNVRVYMTRDDDVFIPLKARVAKARQRRADLFVSIHADAFTDRSARGSSVFALSTKSATSSFGAYLAQTQNESDLIGGVSKSGDRYVDHALLDMAQTATISSSLKLGGEVLSRMKKINKLHKNRVEQAGFAVLKAPDIPSILVETAFISNLEEERKLRTAHFQQQMAESICLGIKAYFGKRWG